MDALILAGGFGTRLRPLTFSTPKPLIPFCNKPIIQHQIEALIEANVKTIIIAISFCSNTEHEMKGFAKSIENKYKIKIILSVETRPLGTAGPIAMAEKHIKSENFFVLNSDVTCNYPLRDLYDFHVATRSEGTILTTKVKNPSRYGVIKTGKSGHIKCFVEKPKEYIGSDINAGIYCLNRLIFKRLSIKKMSIENEVFPKMVDQHQLYSYKLEGEDCFWTDIGKPEDYLFGTKLYLKARKQKIYIGANPEISKTAKLRGFVVMGDNTTIEDGAEVEDSVIFSGTVVGKNAILKNSIVGFGCILGHDSKVVGMSILDSGVAVSPKSKLENNLVCSHKTVNSDLEKGKIVI